MSIEVLPPAEWLAAWETSPALITVTHGPHHVLVFQNAASRTVFGPRPLGVPLVQAFPDTVIGPDSPIERVLRTGEAVSMQGRLISTRDVEGDEVVLTYALAPIGDPPSGVVVTAVDVTGAVRAKETADRSALLAEITNAVTAAPDAESGLQALTDALVPGVADLAAVYVVPQGATDDLLDGPPLPPQVLTMSEELAAFGPLPDPEERQGPSPWDPILRAGRTVVIPIDEQTLPLVAREEASRTWMTMTKTSSIAVVPLVAAGRMTGALVLVAAGNRSPFHDGHAPFLEDVAARAGSAIATVRTHNRQRALAAELQDALLPAAPRRLPGLSTATRYVAGAVDVEVGGDWWDVCDLGGGRVALGIGDVSGRGVAAAAVMGQLRAVMRAAGLAGLPPVEALSLLDAQLVDLLEAADGGRAPVRFATASYAVVEPAPLRLRLANAGHLPVLVRAAAGAVRRVDAPPGAPLGLGVGGFVEVTEALEPDDTLVLFTDGLVESRVLDIDVGLGMLADALAACGGHDDLEVVADALLQAMERRQGHGPDDVALVVVRLDA